MPNPRPVALVLAVLLISAAACESGGNGHTTAESNTPSSEGDDVQTTQSDRSEQGPPSASVDWEPDQRLDPGDVPPADDRLELSEDEWRERLTDEEFEILRKNGTEPAGSGDLLDEKREGVYYCAGCGNPVFSSRAKFEKDTWPSFFAPYHPDRIGSELDESRGMKRTEIHCARCGGHLGHVFDDGPEPTGKRFCINSAALDFKSVDEIASAGDDGSEEAPEQ